MPREPEILAVTSESLQTATEPPRVYIRACGALCDAFWWARRTPPAEPGDSADRERDE
jgi:hypothetical protein